MDVFDGRIEIAGLQFGYEIKVDEDMGEPWKEHDGHGPVSKWVTRSKRPGEEMIAHDGRRSRYYDFQEAMKIAKRDGWGIGAEAMAALKGLLGREPTRGEVAMAAVGQDQMRMRAWCNDEWYWVGVVVTLLDIDGKKTHLTESVWGIESDSEAYHAEVAHDLAASIAQQVGDAKLVTHSTRARTEQITVRVDG